MALKSSWELALERTSGAGSQKLTADQKAKLAELDKVYTAKIAEQEITEKPKIAAAQAAGDADRLKKLDDYLRHTIQKLRDECERKKEEVRQAK